MNKSPRYKFWQKLISYFLIFIFLFIGVPTPNFDVSAESNKTRNNLAVLLVEESLFKAGEENDVNALSGKIFRYSEDIRNNLTNTKTLILTVNKNITPVQITDTLEKFYFDGDVNDFEENYLIGTILIGDIPLPEVFISESESIKSVAPYTDFKEKAFIYSPEKEKFIRHKSDFKPEIWHGIIPSFKTNEELSSYFDENHKYYTGEKKIDREIFYADLLAEKKSFNESQLDFYKNTVEHAEDIAYKRFTNKLLNKLSENFADNIIPEDSATDKKLKNIKDDPKLCEKTPWGNCPKTPKDLVDSDLLKNNEENLPDIYSFFQIQNYIPEYANVVKSYIQDVYTKVTQSGRWQEKDVNYFAKEITFKDVEMRETLKQANDLMKDSLVEFIENKWQKPVAIPFKLYGQNADDIKSVKDCTWYRGSVAKNEDDLSQIIAMNRTFDPYASECNDYAGCCVENYSKPEKCNPSNAKKSVISPAGSRLSLIPSEPSYEMCVQSTWYNEKEKKFETSFPPLRVKEISSIMVHNEPTDEVIKEQIKSKVAKNLPVDEVHYVDFQDQLQTKVRIDLPNFFKTGGKAVDFIKSKTQELKKMNPGIPDNIFIKNFSDELLYKLNELIAWKNFSISQKYHYISLTKLFQAPENKNKNELLYLRAKTKGDKVVMQINPETKNKKDIMQEIWKDQIEKEEEKSIIIDEETEIKLEEKCGSYEGVEIWEWPESIMCWLKELKSFKFISTESKNAWEESWKELEEELSFYDKDEKTAMEEPSKIIVPEIISIIKSQNEDSPKKFKINITLEGENQKPYKAFSEITVILPKGIETDAKDINLLEDGLQIAVMLGIAELTIWTNSDANGNILFSAKNISASTVIEILESPLLKLEIIPKKTEELFSSANLKISTEKPFYGNVPIYFSESSKIIFYNKNPIIHDGEIEIPIVYKNSGSDILFSITSPYFEKQTFKIPAKESIPTSFSTEEDIFVQAGETINLKVKIIDQFSELFLGSLDFKFFITPDSNNFTNKKSQIVKAENGEAKIEIPTNGIHGNVYVALMADNMKTKIININIGTEFSNDDIKNTSSVFTFFVQEGSGNVTEFIQSMLLSGTASIAHKKFISDANNSYKFELNEDGSFLIADSDILVEHDNNFQFSALNTKNSEKYLTWSLKLPNNPTISNTDENADIYVSFVDNNLLQLNNNEVILEGEKIIKVDSNGIHLNDNRFSKNVLSENGKTIIEFLFKDIPILRTIIKSQEIDVTSQNLLVIKEGSEYFIEAENSNEDTQSPDYLGWEGEDISLLESASRTSFGEAFLNSQNEKDIFWGDPVLSYKLEDFDIGDSGFDKTLGKKVFESNSTISNIHAFNYNNDRNVDILLKRGESTLTLLEGTESGDFINRGDYGLLAGGLSYFNSGDFFGDGYDDIILGSKSGKVYFFENIQGHISPEKVLFETDSREIKKIEIHDFDQDGIKDIVFSTSRGELVIRYGSASGFEEEEIITSLGINILNENLVSDLAITQKVVLEDSKEETVYIRETIGAEVKALPMTFVGLSQAKKYFSSKDRNSLDVNSIINVDIVIPKSELKVDAYIIDKVPEVFSYIFDSASCNDQPCNVQALQDEEYAIAFGPIKNVNEDIHILYQMKNTVTFDIDFSIDEEEHQINIPQIKTGYKIVSDRIWNSITLDFNKEEKTSENTSENNDEDNSNDPTDALDDSMENSWGVNKSTNNLSLKDKVESKLNDVANFLQGLNCMSGGCLAVPFNKAFLVPGMWSMGANLSLPGTKGGLAQTIGKVMDKIGIPIGPNLSPMPIFGIHTQACPVAGAIPMPCFGTMCYSPVSTPPCVSVTSPSDFRIYMSPTLTAGLGIAICTGHLPGAYLGQLLSASADPTGNAQSALMKSGGGKCIAFAPPLPYQKACDKINESIEDFFEKANEAIKGKINKGKTLFNVDGAVESGSPETVADKYQGITIGIDTFKKNIDKPQNKSTYPFPRNLFTRWWDAQLSEFGKLLILPTVTLYYPKMDKVLDFELDQWKEALSEFKDKNKKSTSAKKESNNLSESNNKNEKNLQNEEASTSSIMDFINKYNDKISDAGENIEDKMQDVFDLVENLPLLDIQKKVVDIDIPWINPQEISSIIAELEKWIEVNEKEVERFKKMVNTIEKDCKNLETKEDRTSCEKHIKFSTNVSKLLEDAEKSLVILKSYQEFPRKLAKYKSGLSYYFVDVIEYINSLINVLGGWLTRNRLIAERYINLVLTIKEIVKGWKNINLVFKDYMKSCDSCKADAYSQNANLFDVLMAFIPSPPVVVFPTWPDIILDVSHIEKMQISIPQLRFHVKEISLYFDLQPLNLPKDPNIVLGFDLDLDIPHLPELPILPDLPEFPNLPIPQLPDLPPPPKLPSGLKCFGNWLEILKLILKIYCLVKNGIWVYPEASLTQIIEALTNRSTYPFLPSDFLQLQWPDIKYPWVDSINVDTYLKINPKFGDLLYIKTKEQADKFNEFSNKATGKIQQEINEKLNYVPNKVNEAINEANKKMREAENFMENIEEYVDDATNIIEDKTQESIDKNTDKLEGLIEAEERLANLQYENDIPVSVGMKNLYESNLEIPNIENLKNLKNHFIELVQQEKNDVLILENTKNLFAINSTKEKSEFTLTADSPSVLNNTITLRNNQNKVNKELSKQIKENQDNIENSDKYRNGLYIFNEETNTSEKITSYNEEVLEVSFIDHDKDFDEDIFYIIGKKLYLKESYENNSNISNSYKYSTQIGDFKNYIPIKRSVNDLETNSENKSVNISWLEDLSKDNAGYLLEKKQFIYGFDFHNQTNSEYVFLLKDPLFNSEYEVLGKTSTKIGNTIYSFKKNETAQIKKYSNPEFVWDMPNDFYYIKIYSINNNGEKSVSSEQKLLSPQNAHDKRPPLLLENNKDRVPVLKEWPVAVGTVHDTNQITYHWDIDKDGKDDHVGDFYNVPASEELGSYPIKITAKDISGNSLSFEKIIEVFAPEIVISEANVKEVKGYTEPRIPLMPFVLIRKRGDTLKMIKPENSERFFTDTEGNFLIEKDDKKSGVLVRDKSGGHIALVNSETGSIKLFKEEYSLKVLPATDEHPTQILIINEKNEIATIVSYVSSGNNVTIASNNEEFSESQDNQVMVFDTNKEDEINILPIPKDAHYFKNGVALTNKQKEIIVAISPQGSIRLIDKFLYLDYEQIDDQIFFLIKNDDSNTLAKVNINAIGASAGKNHLELVSEFSNKKAILGNFAFIPISRKLEGQIENNMQARSRDLAYDKLEIKSRDLVSKQIDIPDLFSDPEETSNWIPAMSQMEHLVSGITINKAYADEDTSTIEKYLDINEKNIFEEKDKKDLEFPFKDINSDHPYANAIIDLYKRNILKGYDDGSFRPNAKISRAEFVKVALGATTCFDCSTPTETTKELFKDKKPFPDISLTDWFYYCISIAKKEKMVTGYGDGFFHPNKNISRKEAVAVLLRQAEVELTEMPENSFKDIPEYDWARDYVYTAVQIGLMKNIGGFTFPNEEISRGEFAMMASRILELRDCKIYPEYKDTHDFQTGKLPEEEKITEIPKIPETKTMPDGTKITEYPDGSVKVENPDGTIIEKDPDDNIVKTMPDGTIILIPPEKLDSSGIGDKELGEFPYPYKFSGICPEFKDSLCPYLPEDFTDISSGILIEPVSSSIFPPLNYPKLSSIECIFVDDLEDIQTGDIIFAVIISSDDSKIFSKSNEVTTISNEQ